MMLWSLSSRAVTKHARIGAVGAIAASLTYLVTCVHRNCFQTKCVRRKSCADSKQLLSTEINYSKLSDLFYNGLYNGLSNAWKEVIRLQSFWPLVTLCCSTLKTGFKMWHQNNFNVHIQQLRTIQLRNYLRQKLNYSKLSDLFYNGL